MATYNMNSTSIAALPNVIKLGYTLDKVCCMAINDSTLYVIKSKSNTQENKLYPCTLFKIKNFNTKQQSISYVTLKNNGNIIKIANHANGLTYAEGFLYLATKNPAGSGNPQLVKFNENGTIVGNYFYYKDNINRGVSNIAYIGKDTQGNLKFIVGKGRNEQNKYKYEIAVLKNNRLEYDGISFFSQTIGEEWIPNDIHYQLETSKLCSVYSKRDNQGRIYYNKIFIYKIPNIINNFYIEPYNIYNVNMPTKYNKKFEIEGAILSGNTKYVCCNVNSTNPSYNKDAVFKLSQKK